MTLQDLVDWSCTFREGNLPAPDFIFLRQEEVEDLDNNTYYSNKPNIFNPEYEKRINAIREGKMTIWGIKILPILKNYPIYDQTPTFKEQLEKLKK